MKVIAKWFWFFRKLLVLVTAQNTKGIFCNEDFFFKCVWISGYGAVILLHVNTRPVQQKERSLKLVRYR